MSTANSWSQADTTFSYLGSNSKISPENETVIASTEAQLEIWLSSKQSIEANCAYNEIYSLTFNGPLNTDALERAANALVQRHDSLRASFSPDGEKMLIQHHKPFQIERVDWSELNREEVDIARLNLVQEQALIPFALESGPLCRMVLQSVSESEHHLTITGHHIILDGWSFAVLARDLGHLYDLETGKTEQPLPPAVSYRTYSEAMQSYAESDDAQSDRQFWRDQFKTPPNTLELPNTGHRPALRTYFARRYSQTIPSDTIKKTQQIGVKKGCSLFNTLLAAFEVFVARISNSNHFCVAIPAAGQLMIESPDLVGHCVNTMPFQANVDLTRSFQDQLKNTRSQLLNAYDHQGYTFGKILKDVAPPRDPSRPPMMAVSFNLDPRVDAKECGFSGIDVHVDAEPRLFENFEWFINAILNEDSSIEFQIQYNTDLYSAELMRQLFTSFEEFLGHINRQPEMRLGDIPVVSIEQRQKIIVDWNRTDVEYETADSLHQEIARQASESPNKVAVKFGEQTLTYAQLDQRSNQLARYLQQKNVGNGVLVGVCFPRNAEMLIALLGVLKSGAGYVPLDPNFPTDRLQYMCDHSRLEMVIGNEEVGELIAGFGKPSITLEAISKEIESFSIEPTESTTNATSTCYVIYTSGSTGTPKGVEIPHGAVLNLLYSMAQSPGFTAEDSILAVTTLSFDISVLELFLPLIVGGTTVVADKETTADGQALIDSIEKNDITTFQSTPATLRLMISAGWQGRKNLKVLCGGEPMPEDLVAPLLQRCDQLWNMYGPTETTVWSSIYQITDPTASILIGKPIANTQIYVLDNNRQPVPVGADGEIYIGGAGVTLGYLHQRKMTDERFVDNPFFNPFIEYCNHRLYRTGDLGRFQPDGNLRFLRRNDKQVKVRGFRIELGEIEVALKAIPEIEQAVVIVREDKPGDTRLVGYWVAKQGTKIEPAEIRDQLRQQLPYYMVPQHLIPLESFPQTNNKKIDFKALPAPQLKTQVDQQSHQSFAPKSNTERMIADIWKEILEVDEVLNNDNFFDLGGHSLLVMKAITAIEEQTGVRLGPPEFLIGTLQQLADQINQQTSDNDDANTTGEKTEVLNTATTELPSSENGDQRVDPSSQLESRDRIFKKLKSFWD